MSKFTSVTLRPEHCDPLFLLRELGQRHDYVALLESADRAHATNDYSFLALGAKDVIEVRGGSMHRTGKKPAPVSNPLTPFDGIINQGKGGGRLQMGYVGFLSYEAAATFDAIELPRGDIPDGLFFLPETVIRMDHRKREVTIITHEDAESDIDAMTQVILESPFFDDSTRKPLKPAPLPSLEDIEPYRQTSRVAFCKKVRAAQEQILAGEAFQIVLSQELSLPMTTDPLTTYANLRSINPSPYMYYFRSPDLGIVGASPETLLRVEDRTLLYRPIAGTRKRTGNVKEDTAMEQELLADTKERCEHQMLVDLGRSDIGRIAEIGSVQVTDPFHIERYAHVFHIVSDITGTLAKNRTSLDALKSVFPAGTLTGAPKLRAMEIIRQLEDSPRGVYGGAFGYIDLSGNIDMAIAIRTMVFEKNKVSLRVGAGIVKDSVPELEDNECLHKARSCLAAIEGGNRRVRGVRRNRGTNRLIPHS
ncbi:MAG: anthranilate synthase component I family protein [Candidatus Peribacteraceae bacterium]|nr:anthranilate synthase component I family protein [Candidatus Peribacteraceae bacterium]